MPNTIEFLFSDDEALPTIPITVIGLTLWQLLPSILT